MKKFVIATCALLFMSVTANANQVIQRCYNCRVSVGPVAPIGPYVSGPVRDIIPVRPAPAVPVAPVVPVVPTYNYVPTPEASSIYTAPGYPTNVPVAATPNGSCAMYVDPYDLFGQLFGGADLVESCWTRAY